MPPTAASADPPKVLAVHDQRNDNVESPSANAFDDPRKLTSDAIDLINNGDDEDWQNASDELKISACFIYSTQKTSDLRQAGHIEMAKRYRDALDDFYKQLGKKDKVIEILALTLTLDGQEWIKELRPEQQQALTDVQMNEILAENRRVLGAMPDVNDRTVWTTIATITCPAHEKISPPIQRGEYDGCRGAIVWYAPRQLMRTMAGTRLAAFRNRHQPLSQTRILASTRLTFHFVFPIGRRTSRQVKARNYRLQPSDGSGRS